MADEIELKPKIKCPECPEFFPSTRITSHIESHRPFNPAGPLTNPCPKGCGRNLTKSELKEHVPLCERPVARSPGSAPEVALSVPEAPGEKTPKKEEEEVAAKRKCPVCHEMVASGKGFGGHMSKHGKRRKKAGGRKPAERAVQPLKAIRKSNGRRVARSMAFPRAGANLPPAPALHARVDSKLSAIAQNLREAARAKRSEAEELEKMAQRAEELL
jgi:hypothetical protein